MNCRHCHAPLTQPILDLGFAPPSNAYRRVEDLHSPELHYPLRLRLCEACGLVQTEDYARADELFAADYAYFSSTSKSWLAHAAAYARAITERLALGRASQVVELASNDGYLLRNFVAAGIPCLGIEPTASTAAAAEALGIPVLREFFGEALGLRLAAEGRQADLVIGNNVYAHVPDLNDFTRGIAALLKLEGVVTLEFPHLARLVEHGQFDTVYHEHYSYLALATVQRVFAAAGLRVWHVEELATHGGSLRVYGCLADAAHTTTPAVADVLACEAAMKLATREGYASLQARADAAKDGLLAFLLAEKRAGRRVAAYGAAAKGNTLLNYAGVRPDLLPFVVDAAPAKQGRLLPGSHIPIRAPEVLRGERPDTLLVLPWNLATEVAAQLRDLVVQGTRLFIAVPAIAEV
jgi:SAM-dependent methyltransferase